jgi:hypothetical protein
VVSGFSSNPASYNYLWTVTVTVNGVGVVVPFPNNTSATFNFNATKAGTYAVSLKVTDRFPNETATATTTPFSVVAGNAVRFTLVANGSLLLGQTYNLKVTAFDAFGNVATNYAGTVQINTTTGIQGLPAFYTFQPGDNGKHTFSFIPTRLGSQAVSLFDISDSSISGFYKAFVSGSATNNNIIFRS